MMMMMMMTMMNPFTWSNDDEPIETGTWSNDDESIETGNDGKPSVVGNDDDVPIVGSNDDDEPIAEVQGENLFTKTAVLTIITGQKRSCQHQWFKDNKWLDYD